MSLVPSWRGQYPAPWRTWLRWVDTLFLFLFLVSKEGPPLNLEGTFLRDFRPSVFVVLHPKPSQVSYSWLRLGLHVDSFLCILDRAGDDYTSESALLRQRHLQPEAEGQPTQPRRQQCSARQGQSPASEEKDNYRREGKGRRCLGGGGGWTELIQFYYFAPGWFEEWDEFILFSNHLCAIHPIFQIILVQNRDGKELNRSIPQAAGTTFVLSFF